MLNAAPWARAAEEPAANGDPGTSQESTFQGRCALMGKPDTNYADFPPCANNPAACESNPNGFHPVNCLFLLEPLGGQPGYDLFKHECDPSPPTTDPEKEGQKICRYSRWYGEAIVPPLQMGPYQAILAYEPGKDFQGPFGLLYSYLGVVYNFLSGLIIAFVVLVAIIGGVQMIASNGEPDKFTEGRKRITKAVLGMALWFLISVILYTINPTFFTF